MLEQAGGAIETRQVLKTTLSICPECNMIISAEVVERDGKVFLEKECPNHGKFVEVYYGNAEIYKRFSKYAHDGKGTGKPNINIIGYSCPANCGLCPGHLSHTALANIVVTNRCDLYCWYCLPPNEELPVKKDDKVKIMKIGELASELFMKLLPKKAYEGEYIEPQGIFVLSSINGKVKWSRVKRIFRRKYSGPVYRIVTKTGRRIRLTEDHRVLVLKNGKLERLPVAKLAVGDEVLILGGFDPCCGDVFEIDLVNYFNEIPSGEQKKMHLRRGVSQKLIHVPQAESQRIHSLNLGEATPSYSTFEVTDPQALNLGMDALDYEVPTTLVVSPELMELVGYFISEGQYTYEGLRIAVSDKYVGDKLERILTKLDLPHSWLKLDRCGKSLQLVVSSKLLRSVLMHVFKILGPASNKRLPDIIFNLPLRHRISILSALFNGGGYVVRGLRHCSLGYATASPGLARDILYLLASLGIFASLRKFPARKVGGAARDLYKIYISGRDLEKVLSIVELKPSHLKKLQNPPRVKDAGPLRFGDFFIDQIDEAVPESSGEMYDYVYDLEVDELSHSFVAGDGVLISNCFFFAERAGYVYEPSIEQIREMVKNLRREYPVAGNSVQITGGEPCLRDDLPEIIRVIKEEGVDHIQLNTNGIRIAHDFEFFRRVKEAGVSNLYLSFDGVTSRTNPKNHWETPKVIENARRLGVGIVLVPTIIRGVNDDELGDIIKFGFKNIDVIRSVNFQPVSLTGRLTYKEREKYRITIPDCIIKIEEQTNGEITRDSWFPVPACTPLTHIIEALVRSPKYELSTHFACGAGTYVFKNGDRLVPITEFIDIDGLIKYLQDRAEELESGKSRFITAAKILWNFGKYIREDKQPGGINVKRMIYELIIKHDYKSVGDWHRKSLFIGMMHFMSKYDYDIDRVMRCCIHYLTPDGRIIPFCAFNVLPEWYRDRIQQLYGIPVEEWERRTGRKLKDDFYRRVEPSKD